MEKNLKAYIYIYRHIWNGTTLQYAWSIVNQLYFKRDFTGVSVVRTLSSHCRGRVQSLVRELKSYMLCSKNKQIRNYTSIFKKRLKQELGGGSHRFSWVRCACTGFGLPGWDLRRARASRPFGTLKSPCKGLASCVFCSCLLLLGVVSASHPCMDRPGWRAAAGHHTGGRRPTPCLLTWLMINPEQRGIKEKLINREMSQKEIVQNRWSNSSTIEVESRG